MRLKNRFGIVDVAIILAIVAIIAAFAVPNLSRPSMGANEAQAMGTLYALMSAQGVFMNRHGNYGTLDELYKEGLIDEQMASGIIGGYLVGQLRCSDNFSFCFAMAPIEEGKTGLREYCVTQSGIIYEADFDSGLMSAANGTDWLPGQDGVPAFFNRAPENAPDTWQPIGD